LSQSPRKFIELYRLVKSSVITDVVPQNYFPLGRVLLKSRKLPLQSYSINQNLLENPPISQKYGSQWVLIPKESNIKLIPEFFKTSLP